MARMYACVDTAKWARLGVGLIAVALAGSACDGIRVGLRSEPEVITPETVRGSQEGFPTRPGVDPDGNPVPLVPTSRPPLATELTPPETKSTAQKTDKESATLSPEDETNSISTGSIKSASATSTPPASSVTTIASTTSGQTIPLRPVRPGSDEEEIVKMFVGPELVECSGEGIQECLEVREGENGDWRRFYSPIEGFEHEVGKTYELLVRKIPVENVPADGSSIDYVLVEVLNVS